jgi:DNA-binding response OmpR family regulator
MRALIADDDRTTAAILKRSFERWSIDVITAHDGNGAWDLLQSDPAPSLAVIDWMMPGLDGPELCRRIRQHPSLSHLYVMLLTSRDSRADLIAGLEAGADDYLIKPFDPEELRARVHVGLRVLKLQDRLAEQVVELRTALTRVKQLTGLLPICSYCKRIRSDNDYWEQVDSYIAHHSDVQFSHGICPTCFDDVSLQFELEHPAKKPTGQI